LENKDTDCVHGHVPYGVHHFTRRPVRYVTMLRDPVERAVSGYYFIKDLVRTDLWKKHPLRDFADSVTLVEFYEHPRHSNMQARYLAGLAYDRTYPLLHRSSLFRRSLVAAAKAHLDACTAFGLQSEYDRSVRYFQSKLDWPTYTPVPRQAKTKTRPSIAEIKELNPQVLDALDELHDLDREVYEYAQELFYART